MSATPVAALASESAVPASFGASTMQCLARAAAMRCTSAPREENFELVRQPRLRTPWPESKADAQGQTLGRNSL